MGVSPASCVDSWSTSEEGAASDLALHLPSRVHLAVSGPRGSPLCPHTFHVHGRTHQLLAQPLQSPS